MKKNFFIFFFILLSLLSCSKEEKLQNAEIIMLSGEVKVKIEQEIKKVSLGDKIWAGSSVITDPYSSCDLKIKNHIVRCKPDSVISLKDLQKSIRIEIKKGSAIVNLYKFDPSKESFNVYLNDIKVKFQEGNGVVSYVDDTATIAVKDGEAVIYPLNKDEITIKSNKLFVFVKNELIKKDYISSLWENEIRRLNNFYSAFSPESLEKKDLYEISVSTDPSGADIFINRLYINSSPVKFFVNTDEEYEIRSEKPGFLLAEKKIKPETKKTEVFINLKPEPVQNITNFKVESLYKGKIKFPVIKLPTGEILISENKTITFLNSKENIRTINLSTNIIRAPVVKDNSVFVYTADGILSAYRLKEKTKIWQKKVTITGLTISELELFIFIPNAIIQLDPSNGKELWFYPVVGLKTLPVLNYNTIYLYNGFLIIAFDREKNKVLWKTPVSGKTVLPLFIADNKLFFANRTGEVHAFDLLGKLLFTTKTGIQISFPLVYHNNKIFICNSKGELVCIDSKKGNIVWKIGTGRNLTSTPVISDNRLFLGFASGIIEALDPDTGKIILIRETEGKITSLTPVEKGVLAVSEEGLWLISR